MAPKKKTLALSFYESNTCLTAHAIGRSLSFETIHVDCCLDVLETYGR